MQMSIFHPNYDFPNATLQQYDPLCHDPWPAQFLRSSCSECNAVCLGLPRIFQRALPHAFEVQPEKGDCYPEMVISYIPIV